MLERQRNTIVTDNNLNHKELGGKKYNQLYCAFYRQGNKGKDIAKSTKRVKKRKFIQRLGELDPNLQQHQKEDCAKLAEPHQHSLKVAQEVLAEYSQQHNSILKKSVTWKSPTTAMFWLRGSKKASPKKDSPSTNDSDIKQSSTSESTASPPNEYGPLGKSPPSKQPDQLTVDISASSPASSSGTNYLSPSSTDNAIGTQATQAAMNPPPTPMETVASLVAKTPIRTPSAQELDNMTDEELAQLQQMNMAQTRNRQNLVQKELILSQALLNSTQALKDARSDSVSTLEADNASVETHILLSAAKAKRRTKSSILTSPRVLNGMCLLLMTLRVWRQHEWWAKPVKKQL